MEPDRALLRPSLGVFAPEAASNARGSHRRVSRAFTLIEMIVLIIIVAILASIAAPRYSGFMDRAAFERTTEEIVALLAQTREAALRSGGEARVVVDSQIGMLRSEVDGSPPDTDVPSDLIEADSVRDALVRPRPVMLPDDVVIVDRVEFDPPADERRSSRTITLVAFREDGTSTGARVAIASRDGRRAVLETSPSTGRTRMVNEEYE